MRICYVTSEYPVDGEPASGIATYLQTTAETLVEKGHRVDVVLCDQRVSEQTISTINGVRVHAVPLTEAVSSFFHERLSKRYFGLLRWLNVHRELAGYLARSKCAAEYIEKNIKAHVFECPERGFLGHFLCMTGRAVVMRLHTPSAVISRLNRTFSLKYALMEYFERKTATTATAISSPSFCLARKVARRWRIRTPISVEPSPFRLAPVLVDDSQVPPYRYVLYFGRIEIRKGVLLLARAMKRIQPRLNEIRVLFVGTDVEYGRSKDKSVKEEIFRLLGPAASSACFIGAQRRERLYPLIRNAEFVVLPSLWESFPNACLEAMALGKTVLAPSGTGLVEQVRHMESGVLFKRKSHRDLARKMLYCLENPERVREIGVGARAKVADFEAGKMIIRTLRKYHETIGTDRPLSSRPRSEPSSRARWLGEWLQLRVQQRVPDVDAVRYPPTFDKEVAPEVSVIVPSLNEERNIEGCLVSLILQATTASYEIIVVDSSSDTTSRIVLERFPTVVLISSERRLSCGEAKNVGLRFARGRKILFTDADIRVPFDWVQKMADHLERCDIAGGPFLNGTPRSLSGSLGYYLEFFRVMPRTTKVRSTKYFTGGNSGFRREAVETKAFISGIGEDIAFTYDLIRDGKTSIYDPTLGVLHLNKTGLRRVFRYHIALGAGGYRYRRRLGFGSPIMKMPTLSFVVPFAIVPFIALNRFWCRDFGGALFLVACSPLAILLYLFWAYGFFTEARAVESADKASARAGA